MSTDYFPRLASICDHIEAVQVLHNNRFFDIANNSNNNFVFNVDSLYCKSSIYYTEFTTIIPMVCFWNFAMLFRAVSWSMGYILIAKGDSKMF
jgi:PST family polysaccharide transporter